MQFALATAFDATKNIQDATNKEEMEKALRKWTLESQEKAEEMCQFFIDVVHEYLQLGELNLPEISV